MVIGMIANNINHRRIGTACIVQVGNTVCHARPEVQQGSGGFASHACITIRGSGAYTFEKSQYGAHAGYPVQRLHQVHFRGAGVGNAQVYATIGEGLD